MMSKSPIFYLYNTVILTFTTLFPKTEEKTIIFNLNKNLQI